jgi:hypothetical protein
MFIHPPDVVPAVAVFGSPVVPDDGVAAATGCLRRPRGLLHVTVVTACQLEPWLSS